MSKYFHQHASDRVRCSRFPYDVGNHGTGYRWECLRHVEHGQVTVGLGKSFMSFVVSVVVFRPLSVRVGC